jgi:hypothetical protein
VYLDYSLEAITDHVHADGSFSEHESRDAHENGASDDSINGDSANANHGFAGEDRSGTER